MDKRDLRATFRVQGAIGALIMSRVPIPFSAEFSGKALLIDMSYHGCQLFAPTSFPPGTLLEIHASTPTTSTIPSVEAYVLWTKSGPSALTALRWRIGLRYVIPGNHWNLHPLPHSWERAQEALAS